MPALTQDVVKIAVKYADANAMPQLIVFDQTQPLNTIIQNLCTGWNLTYDPENYALQFDDSQSMQFVTEKNRREVKNGTVLQLRFSALKTTRDILEKLRNGTEVEKLAVLKELTSLSGDLTFALEFIKEKGLTILIEAIEKLEWSGELLQHALVSFVELTDHGTVSFDVLGEIFINRNIEFIRNPSKYQQSEIIQSALNILENIVQNGSKHHLVEKELMGSLESLVKLLSDASHPVTQQHTLALINALFMKGNDTTKKKISDDFSQKQYRNVLLQHVLNQKMTQELAHQLYVFQTLTLGLLEQRMRVSVTQHEQEVAEQIMKLKKIAFEMDNNENHSNQLYYKKLGFKCDFNPVKDFMEIPPGMLALDCMIYFATHFEQGYKKVVHESSVRSDEHDCPFGRTSIELIKMLVDVLRIGQTPHEQGIDFQPIFFAHDHPFETLFCQCVFVLNKTWKDMRATTEDFPKVFSVVREQITRTLSSHPKNMEEFTSKISTFSYSKITQLRQQERESREEYESTAPAYVNLKQKIMPEIEDLIKQQRLTYMQQGTRFKKPGQKNKSYYLRLSPNNKVLHYTEGDDKSGQVPTLDEMKNKTVISDIRQLLIGKDCPSTKAKKQNYIFGITIEATEHKCEEYIAPDETSFYIWCDGLNALLGNQMESTMKTKEMETLLSLEIKLRLLDAEGIEISKDPPPVPPEPDNYDFCFEC